MTITSANPEILSELDRPNSYIGKVVPRPNLARLMQGRGLYVSDMELPRMAHQSRPSRGYPIAARWQI